MDETIDDPLDGLPCLLVCLVRDISYIGPPSYIADFEISRVQAYIHIIRTFIISDPPSTSIIGGNGG